MRSVNRIAAVALVFSITAGIVTAQSEQPMYPARPMSIALAAQGSSDRQIGLVSIAAPRSVRISLSNRTTGRIIVQGWDQETISAKAVSERGDEVVIVGQQEFDNEKRVFLKADYANLSEPSEPTKVLEYPPLSKDGGPIQIDIEVKVPRNAVLETIKVIRSNVEITGIETPTSVLGKSSNVTLKDVGPSEVHTNSGAIEIQNARGLTDVTSSSGPITITNSQGDVRATSIAGPIQIKCLKGGAYIENVQAQIELEGIEGDVQATAASGNVVFKGPLRDDGRFFLKTLTGRLEMMLPANTRGFVATLISYRGMIDSDFSLTYNSTAGNHPGGRRIARYKNGSPQITLDSFEGLMKLTKITPSAIMKCN
jgi:hypothetical protein